MTVEVAARVRLLPASTSAPRLMTMARSMLALLSIARRKPVPSAITDSNTATTPVMPTTTTNDEPRRCGRFLKLSSVIAMIWSMALSKHSQGCDDPQALNFPSRQQCADQCEQHRKEQAGHNDAP